VVRALDDQDIERERVEIEAQPHVRVGHLQAGRWSVAQLIVLSLS
jgi:hypothetical protein